MYRKQHIVALSAICALLAGCSGDMEDLEKQMTDIRNRPGDRVEPLPEIKPYEAFVYSVASMRSPFLPSAPAGSDLTTSLRPDIKRSREFLEQFPLDTLRMVGTLEQHGRKYGLVQDKQGLVHRVLPGGYLGQNDGRITEVSAGRIALIQIVPDGVGGYIERPAALTLSE